ncbi:YjbH domain-containing protein [Candidatus Deferrimicrobium sp.]|uniref:YjbH domain-containing protein n=1 Tax=Candidatus Deferrimicrobium sp. TaxID=3060586 RepID=UPI002ED31211
MIFPRGNPGANAVVAALLLNALFHPPPAIAIGGPRPITVTVEGEVRNPGSYTLPYDATLSTLIVAAGGYTDNADLAAATLTRESANTVSAPLSHPRLLKGSPADLPLEDGDTLRIPARAPGAPARTRPRPAGAESFTGPNNFGVTGLFETPTARLMPENRFRLGATQVHPYRYYFGTVGLFDRLEVNGRVTEIIGVKAFTNLPGSSYGDYKDKAVDAKFLLLKEGKYLPALSVVVSDPTGTRLYASQAIVASKRILPLDVDVSLGFGNGRLGKQPLPAQGEGFKVELFTDPVKWAREALPFGGIQYAPAPWLSLLAEYSPIRYERQTTDPAQKKYFPTAVRSPFNFGARVKPLKWLEVDASWQRGNEIGVTASVAFDIGRPLVPIRDEPYLETADASHAPLDDRIALALADVGFSDIAVSSDEFTLRVDVQNNRYFFAPRAVEVLLATIAPLAPPNVEYVRVLLKENGIPVAEAAVPANALSGAGSSFFPTDRIRAAVGFRSANFDAPIRPTTHRRRFDYSLKPSFETFLNDPSGFFKYRVGLAGSVSTFPWRGGTALLGVEGYPVNNISTLNAPLSIPIRSDVAQYKKERITLGRLLFDQVFATRDPAYFRAAAGMLETMFGGVDAEAALPLWNGRILAGGSGSVVRKRAPADPFRFRGNKNYHTALLQGRLNVPEIDAAVDVKWGRFLAGDRGVRVAVSKFIRGVTLSAWYSATDTDVFTDPFNRGYHDKGISVEIPIRLFTGRDSKTAYRYSLSPWTRDVAQDIDRYLPLFDRIGRNAGVLLDRDQGSIYRAPR